MKNNEMIDRYVYAVTKNLTDDMRNDIGKELRMNIEDMLPDNATEKNVREVLEELGDPSKLAQEYHPKKRYLIGPGLYYKYITILKLVSIICVAVSLGISTIQWVIEVSGSSFQLTALIELFVNLLVTVFYGVLQGVFWVTLVFVVLERSGVDEDSLSLTGGKWSVDDMPEIPLYNQSKISRGETVFSIFMTILFTSLIYFKPQLIAIYFKDSKGIINSIPLFNVERLKLYLIVILVLAILQLGLSVWKFVSGYWKIPIAIANATYNAGFLILVLQIVNDNALYNDLFLQKLQELIQLSSSETIEKWFDVSVTASIVVIVVICVWDSVSAFLKCRITSKKGD